MTDKKKEEKRNYLIQQGNLYWRPASSGYTPNLWQAGLYTADEAKRIRNLHRNPLDKPIKVTKDHITQIEIQVELMRHGLNNLKLALGKEKK